MPRLNPLGLARLEPVRDSREFTDPSQPGHILSLTLLAASDAASKERRTERSRHLMSMYLTGDAEYVQSDGKSGKAPIGKPIKRPSVAGESSDVIQAIIGIPGGAGAADPSEPVTLTGGLCFIVGSLMDLQESAAIETYGERIPPEERPYTFIEWLTLSQRMPNAFDAVVKWADSLLTKAETSPNSSGAANPSTDSPSDKHSAAA